MCRCEQAFRPTTVTTLAIVTAAAGLDWSGVCSRREYETGCHGTKPARRRRRRRLRLEFSVSLSPMPSCTHRRMWTLDGQLLAAPTCSVRLAVLVSVPVSRHSSHSFPLLPCPLVIELLNCFFQRNTVITSPPVGEANYCLSVCLSVREHISGTTRPVFTLFLCVLPMAVARSSSGGVAISCVLPVYG